MPLYLRRKFTLNHDEKMNYFWKGLILFGAISASILFFFFLFKLKDILNGFETVLNVLAPISYGLILAYILTPIYNKFEKTAPYPSDSWQSGSYSEYPAPLCE